MPPQCPATPTDAHHQSWSPTEASTSFGLLPIVAHRTPIHQRCFSTGETCASKQLCVCESLHRGTHAEWSVALRRCGQVHHSFTIINKQVNQYNRASYVRCDVISSHGSSPLQILRCSVCNMRGLVLSLAAREGRAGERPGWARRVAVLCSGVVSDYVAVYMDNCSRKARRGYDLII